MGSATSLPGAVAQDLFDDNVMSGSIDANGNLWLTKLDGTSVQAGNFQQYIQNLINTTVTQKMNALKTSLQTQGLIIPAGTFLDGTTKPTGSWLLCDGSEVSKTTYAALFTAIGATWGSTTTTFRIPDFRDRDRIGPGSRALGASDGVAEASRVAARLAGHTHTNSLYINPAGNHTHQQDQNASNIRSISQGTGGGVNMALQVHDHPMNGNGDHGHNLTGGINSLEVPDDPYAIVNTYVKT